MLPENSEAAQGRIIPSHCSRARPIVGSQSSSVNVQLSRRSSRSRAAANATAKAIRPEKFHGANKGHTRVGNTGEMNRGAASEMSASEIDAGNECDCSGTLDAGG